MESSLTPLLLFGGHQGRHQGQMKSHNAIVIYSKRNMGRTQKQTAIFFSGLKTNGAQKIEVSLFKNTHTPPSPPNLGQLNSAAKSDLWMLKTSE